MENDPSAADSAGSAARSTEMGTSRVEAFSDGVLAVAITIMVLDIKPPDDGSINALAQRIPAVLVYVLSFTFIGIYWNNHHHLLHATRRVNVSVMWANLHLLFWLSLIPAATSWVSHNPRIALPAFIYGFIGLMAGIAFNILVHFIRQANKGTALDQTLASSRKGWVSMGLYSLGAALSFVNPLLSYTAYAAVSVMWFIPDRRLA